MKIIPYNNKQLVRDLKQDVPEAFRLLYKTYFSGLYHFANSIINNELVAKDIVQEVFITVWDRRKNLKEANSIENYLYVAVRNSCYTYLKREKQHLDLEALQNVSIPAEVVPEIENSEDRILWDAVESLPLQCKIIFKLIVIEEYSYKEVAEKLGISVNTVKTQMIRACQSLRKKLTSQQGKLLFFILFSRFL